MAVDTTVPIEQWTFNKRLIENINNKQFASAKTLLVGAGPPKWSDVTNINQVSALGLLQQVGIQQQRAITRLFEIGSRDPYFVHGRDTNRATLSRIMYHGPSLMKVLMQNTPYDSGAFAELNNTPHAKPDATDDGSGCAWLNLSSIVFEDPHGLLLNMETFQQALNVGDNAQITSLNQGARVFAVYLEECNIDSHSVSVDSGSVVIAESVGIQWARTIPIF